MQLFTAMLGIDKKMTRENSWQLIEKWNKENPHQGNRISDLNLSEIGKTSFVIEANALRLSMAEYSRCGIIAVRFEKTEPDGVVWTTDYVMNFTDMRMSVRLERDYLCGAQPANQSFSAPHFISLLIDEEYIKPDWNLQVRRTPLQLTADNLYILTDLINGYETYRMPVVYISKTQYNEDPVDAVKLANRLKGIAHVLVEDHVQLNTPIKNSCDRKNEYNGAIGIYFPDDAFGHQRIYHQSEYGYDQRQAEIVVQRIMQYCNSQRIGELYTWQGVLRAKILEQLTARNAELSASEKKLAQAEEEAGQLLEMSEADVRRLRKQLEDMTKTCEALTYENYGLKEKLSSREDQPVLYLGKEKEFYQNEIREFILDAIESSLPQYAQGSRRRDVLEDILAKNECQRMAAARATDLKVLLKGFKCVTAPMKRSLQDLGFEFRESTKHYKLVYYGDDRYIATLSKTPSDARSGMNLASSMIKTML